MKTSITNTSITEGQKKQYLKFVKDVAKRARKVVGLDKDGLQKLIKNGDEFQTRIVTAIRELSMSNQFAGEKTESSYGYPSGHKPKKIPWQTKRLCELFPEIGTALEELCQQDLPLEAEGWFAIPRWEKIAPTYGEAVQKVLDLIRKEQKGMYNYREGQLGPQYLRQSQKASRAWKKLGDEQKDYDILIVPAQFGLRHRNRSVCQAREAMDVHEFGLGTFAIGIMLLTHPERLQYPDVLWIDCAGDQFALNADDVFSESPSFGSSGDQVGFNTLPADSNNNHCGSASGFVSQ